MTNKSKILAPVIGLIVTQPAAFFRQYDQVKWLAKMESLNADDGGEWYRVMGNIPTKEFLYIYSCYDGKIQFRTNGTVFRNIDLKCPRPEGGIRTFRNASGIVHCGPFVKAPFEIPFKGFQGFRYTDKELW